MNERANFGVDAAKLKDGKIEGIKIEPKVNIEVTVSDHAIYGLYILVAAMVAVAFAAIFASIRTKN